MPVILDIQHVDTTTGELTFRVEATVSLHESQPVISQVAFSGPKGLDTAQLQHHFRWRTPLDVVTMLVPSLIKAGIDPFAFAFPLTDFPDAARLGHSGRHRLTDEFLTEIAEQYLEIGRGYAQAIATERGVAPRTVVSWVERARKRGILSPVRKGQHGGTINP